MDSTLPWSGWFVIVWVMVSGAALCLWSGGFYTWMRRRGIEFPTWWSGTIGQRERVYRAWSAQHGRDGRWPLRTTRILFANLVASLFASVLYLILTR